MKNDDGKFGCAYSPGKIENDSNVYFYDLNEGWNLENKNANIDDGRDLVPAAVHALGFAIGFTNSSSDMLKNDKYMVEHKQKEIQKIYNPQRKI